MARIAGVTLPNNKRVQIGLTYIFGIGNKTADDIILKAEIDPNTRIKDLTDNQVNKLRSLIDSDLKVEGELKRDVLLNIKRLKEIASFRGSRHSKGLPSRGQRTKTNSRTVRGNARRTMGSGRKASAQKT